MSWWHRGVGRRARRVAPSLERLEDRTVLSFALAGTYPTGTEPGSVVVGDFNRDGRADLAVANILDNTVSILTGNGDGSFGAAVNYIVGTRPRGLVAGNFRGGGLLDLAVVDHIMAGDQGFVSVLLNNGDGTFRPGADYPVGTSADGVAVGDFNRDGKLDLVVTNYGANTVSILLGNGDGTFQAHQDFAANSSPESVAVADFNGDSKPDLVVTDRGGGVSVLLGNGDGTFGAPVTYAAGPQPFDVAVADFNRDGRPDLAVADRGGGVSVLLGHGDGTFGPAVTYAAGTNPWSVAAADLNGDGVPDLAVANNGSNNVSVLLGNGDGSFQGAVNYDAGGAGPFAIAVGDFNGDTAPDLVVADRDSGYVAVLLNLNEATHLGFNVPSAVTAGQRFDVTVTALSAFNTPATGYLGTVHFVATNGATADYTFTAADQGRHTFNIAVYRAGSLSVTGTDTANPSITGGFTVTVNPAAAAQIALVVPSVTAGVPFSITVTVQDAYGNTVTGYLGTVHFTLTGPAMAMANYTFTAADRGSHTFSNLVLNQAGTYTLTGTDTADPTLTGSTMFTVVPPALPGLAFQQEQAAGYARTRMAPWQWEALRPWFWLTRPRPGA
jgi:hypothetical protein